ncbi:hypothetical protein ACI7RC_11550 [Brevibacillus sp. B_LB10_24]|uniref:hypothetical protein n=1 Tax=Brevibacillus sp. B_LB10_24 TaxID=3380645 RepID=UPI0038B93A40
MPRKLVAAVMVSAFLALMLSFVPALTREKYGLVMPTMREVTPIVVTEQNLVDLFTLTPTHYNIKRVKWENHSLYVDFYVTPAQSIEAAPLYQDFYTLAYHSFSLTRNVDNLFFRLLEEGISGRTRVLLAISAERSNQSRAYPAPERIDDIVSFVQKNFPVREEPGFAEKLSP